MPSSCCSAITEAVSICGERGGLSQLPRRADARPPALFAGEPHPHAILRRHRRGISVVTGRRPLRCRPADPLRRGRHPARGRGHHLGRHAGRLRLRLHVLLPAGGGSGAEQPGDALRLVGHLYLPLHADRRAPVHAAGPAVGGRRRLGLARRQARRACADRLLVFGPMDRRPAHRCRAPRARLSADRPRPRHRQRQHDHRPRAPGRGALAGPARWRRDRPADGAHAEAASHPGARVPRHFGGRATSPRQR